MPHQAIRKPQASTAGKPGALLCSFGASAPNVCSSTDPRHQSGEGHKAKGIHQHQTGQPGRQTQRKQGAGKGPRYVLMSRARINGAGRLARARKPGRIRSDFAIILQLHRTTGRTIDLYGIFQTSPYNYYVKYSDISNSINGLWCTDIKQGITALHQSHCSKGAPCTRPALGNQSPRRVWVGAGIQGSAGNSLYISDTYAPHQPSATQRVHRGRPLIRFTPYGQVKRPIAEIGRQTGRAPHS